MWYVINRQSLARPQVNNEGFPLVNRVLIQDEHQKIKEIPCRVAKHATIIKLQAIEKCIMHVDIK
jgi:hypothetical protein